MADEPETLMILAGPPKPSPPLTIALLIVALGMIGPIVVVRTAVPSPFLTTMILLVPLAGLFVLLGAIDARRRWHGDRAVRVRAEIGPAGILLRPRPGREVRFPWSEIAIARVSSHALMLYLQDAQGKRWRRAIRYAGLVTPVMTIEAQLNLYLQKSGSKIGAERGGQ